MTNNNLTPATIDLPAVIARLEKQRDWAENLADTYRAEWITAIGAGDDAAAADHNNTKHRYEGRVMGLGYAIEELRAIAQGY